MPDLSETVALVTGASRAAGQAIAATLGERAATVYITGRSVRGSSTSRFPRETLDDTAEMVAERGGTAIPVRVDHADDAQVRALIDRIRADHGRLDLLVNNAWAGYEDYDDTFVKPFWEQPLTRWDKMLTIGLRSHFVTAYHAVSLMLPLLRGLIVNTTTYMHPEHFGFSTLYDTVKTAITRLSFCMAHDLRPHNIAAVALAPGFMRTQTILDAFNTDEEHWQTVPDLKNSETPAFIGRAIAALAADPAIMQKSGQLLTSGRLSKEYGFTDLDGRQPNFYDDELYATEKPGRPSTDYDD